MLVNGTFSNLNFIGLKKYKISENYLKKYKKLIFNVILLIHTTIKRFGVRNIFNVFEKSL